MVLMLMAYTSVLCMFFMLVCGADQLKVEDARDILERPLMTLLGGALAIGALRLHDIR